MQAPNFSYDNPILDFVIELAALMTESRFNRQKSRQNTEVDQIFALGIQDIDLKLDAESNCGALRLASTTVNVLVNLEANEARIEDVTIEDIKPDFELGLRIAQLKRGINPRQLGHEPRQALGRLKRHGRAYSEIPTKRIVDGVAHRIISELGRADICGNLDRLIVDGIQQALLTREQGRDTGPVNIQFIGDRQGHGAILLLVVVDIGGVRLTYVFVNPDYVQGRQETVRHGEVEQRVVRQPIAIGTVGPHAGSQRRGRHDTAIRVVNDIVDPGGNGDTRGIRPVAHGQDRDLAVNQTDVGRPDHPRVTKHAELGSLAPLAIRLVVGDDHVALDTLKGLVPVFDLIAPIDEGHVIGGDRNTEVQRLDASFIEEVHMDTSGVFASFTQIRVKRLNHGCDVGGGGVRCREEVRNGIDTNRAGGGDHHQRVHRRLGDVELQWGAIRVAVEHEGNQQGFASGTFDDGVSRHAQAGQCGSHPGSKH